MMTVTPINHRLDRYTVHTATTTSDDDVDYEERWCEDCGRLKIIHPLTGDDMYESNLYECRCNPWS